MTVRMSVPDSDDLVHLGDGSQTLCGLFGYEDDSGQYSGMRQRLCSDCSRWETHGSLAAEQEEASWTWDDDEVDDRDSEADDYDPQEEMVPVSVVQSLVSRSQPRPWWNDPDGCIGGVFILLVVCGLIALGVWWLTSNVH